MNKIQYHMHRILSLLKGVARVCNACGFKRYACATFLFLLVSLNNHAQLISPLSDEFNRRIEQKLNQSGTLYFSVWKPYFDNQLVKGARQDSSALFDNEKQRTTWFGRKLLSESFLQIDSPDFYLYADPLFNLSAGWENPGKSTYINTRGFRAGGRLGNHFAFGTDFYENQAQFPHYINQRIDSINVVPGQGRVHSKRIYGWDYANSSGYLSYSPINTLNIQFGQGKTFIGDGYRSLLYSGSSYSYPYTRFTWQSGCFMYSWMVNAISQYRMRNSFDQAFHYRASSIRLASVNILRTAQLSIIQETMFNDGDTISQFKLTPHILNPVMMPLSYSKDFHSFWGVNIKLKILPTLYVYNQWMLDNLGGAGKLRKGLQAGLKYFDALGLKGLYIQGEYNRIDAQAYTNPYKQLSWAHYNEPIAHPYGNNFEELVGIASFTHKRWQLITQINLTQALNGQTDGAEFRKTGIVTWKTDRKLFMQDVQLNYYLNAKTLSCFSLGSTYRRDWQTSSKYSSTHIYFAFRTSLSNLYYAL